MSKIIVIMQKEWLQLRKQPLLVLPMVLLPLLFLVLPLISASGSSNMTNIPSSMLENNPLTEGMSVAEITQVLTGQVFRIMLLILPLMIPNIIASYSIVGEKTNRTLEPVLATPITVWELLTAKCLTATLPAVIMTWLVGVLFIGEIGLISKSARVVAAIVSPGWLILFFLAAPLMALLSVAITVMISSRVNEPRSAQQISAVVIVPLIGLMLLQVGGLVILSPALGVVLTLVLAVISMIAMWLATLVFQREAILTRWK
ncbi:MAG TPA: ABC transporter permease subunit [Aggregatilineales bacterium]|nr:ABC transporter permease subunit [Aggregatilineales bacterium]